MFGKSIGKVGRRHAWMLRGRGVLDRVQKEKNGKEGGREEGRREIG